MSIMMLRCLWACLALLLPFAAPGQFYSTGSDPIELHWQRLRGDLWSIDADTAAARWALCADRELSRVAPLLYSDFSPALRRRPVSVIVHSRHAYSNGLVSWAPKRLEAFAYDIGADDCVPWVRHLMTHEYRHVLQTQSTICGFSRGLYALFGEQSVGLVLGLFAPRWALEGDAVWAETQYTFGGRGRDALFLQQMRSLVAGGSAPSYSQAYFGSFGRRVPDYYHMGYLMVSAVSDTLGNAVWSRALEAVGRKPFTFVPFPHSLRRQTSMRPMALYSWAIDHWTEIWKTESACRAATPSRPLWPRRADYEEVLHPVPCAGGWMAHVSSPACVAHFAVIDSLGREVWRLTPSTRNEERFCLRGDTLVWSERRQHPRWANASESVIMMARLPGGAAARLTCGGNYHSPSLSACTDSLAAVLSGPDLAHSIVVGRVGESLTPVRTFPVGWQVPEVAWLSADSLLAVIVAPDGSRLVRLCADGSGLVSLMGPLHSSVRDVVACRGEVFFSMDSCGYSDVYSLRLADGLLLRRAVGRQGVRSPHPLADGSGLVVCSYGASGYRPVAVSAMVSDSCGVSLPVEFAVPADTLCGSFRRVGPFETHLLPNVHSWGPVVVDAAAQSVRPGLGLASQNTHGTVSFQAGLNLLPDYADERLFASVSWDWLWPRLTFSGKWGHADYSYSVSRAQESSSGGKETVITRVNDRSRLSRLTFGLSVPLVFNSGAWLRAVTPSAAVDRRKSTGLQASVERVSSGGVSSFGVTRLPGNEYLCATYGLSAHLLRRMAERDIGYRLGASVSAVYDDARSFGDYGRLLCLTSRFYLPGFGRHHQFSLMASAQSKWPGGRLRSASGHFYRRMLSGRIAVPYGLASVACDKSAFFRMTYAMPLLNPDWQLGPVAYVKRVNLRLVADYAIDRLWNGLSPAATLRRKTASAELWADTRFFLLPFPVNIGCRATWRPDCHDVCASLLLSVSFL